jgi:hypothetical protein
MTTDPTPQTSTVQLPHTGTEPPRSMSIDRRNWRLGAVLVRVRPWLLGPAVILLSLWPVVVSVAERPRFDSQRRDGAITVDGKFDDWYGQLQPFGSDPLAIQFLNDGDFLYIRLTVSDAVTRTQIRRQGMTVWFDPSGGTKKKFGIRYPVVEPGAESGGRGRRGEGPPDEAAAPSDRVDIIGPGKDDARSLTRDHLSGVEIAMRPEEGTLHYEVKVPLVRTADHPYAIDTAPGKTIGVGLETGKTQQRSFGEGRGGGFGGGGGGGGGMGGGRRGPGGGMGGGGGRGRGGADGQRDFQPPKPLKSWGIVAIAPVR